MVLIQWDPYWAKERILAFIIHKEKFKMDHRIKLKKKFLEENVGEYLHDLWEGKDSLNMIRKRTIH